MFPQAINSARQKSLAPREALLLQEEDTVTWPTSCKLLATIYWLPAALRGPSQVISLPSPK
jgi:hypothetical protein